MLRLTLAGNEIELYENEPVNLSYQFSDIQDINASSSSFSQTFRVPLTKKNQDYFGAVNEFGLITTWNPKVKVDAELTYNTIPVMRGFAQVKAVYVQKGKYADVEIAVFGETANLSRDIGDGMLTDLDLSAYDHTLNATNIEASWAGNLSGGVIRYGLPDKGQNWTSSNIWTTTNPLEHGDFTPYFRASKLFEEIMTEAGYTYDSTFLTRVDGLYLAMYNGNLAIKGNRNPQAQTAFVGYSADVTGLSSTTFVDLTGFSDSAPFYDTDSNFNGTTYTAPFRAYYTFRVYVHGQIDHLTNTTLTMRLAKGGSTFLATIIDNLTGAFFNGESFVVLTNPILLNSGDAVSLQYALANSGHTVDFTGTDELGSGGTGFEVVEVSGATSGQTVDTEANMPQMKQIDFIAGLQKMFNLVFIPDRNNSKHLEVEPFNDYIASGSQKDWTNKIDLSKDLTIAPTTDLQARQYDWTHSNGKDLINDIVFKNASRVYGRYRVDDPENDFASGNKEIKTPFAPHVASYIPGTQYAIHRMLIDTEQNDNTIKDPLPRLAFWNGQQDGTIYYQNDANAATIPETEYPAFSQFSSLEATITNEDLGFGAERPFHIVEANPLNTLYYKYWRPFVNELYSSDARKLTAFFRLTRSELATFEFSDKIYIKDTYWRILSISYDATSEDLVKVEMLKVLGEIRDCVWLPESINKATGEIRFENALGTLLYQLGPQNNSCCTKYGYIYNATAQRCYQPFEQ